MSSTPVRVAIVADLLEERWPSMDLVADRLFAELQAQKGQDLQVQMIRPTLRRTNVGVSRFVRRFWDYPQWLRAQARAFDVFHIIDHSYAHLVHVLPSSRTIVTCHDIDAFLPIVQPDLTTSRLPKPLVRRVLSGMRKAIRVTCDSQATYDDICHYDLVSAGRLDIVRMGTHTGYCACSVPAHDQAIDRLLGPRRADVVELLHVGSSIGRKRIDLLLQVVAAVRRSHPSTRLLKAGGPLTSDQRELAQRMEIAHAIVELPFLDTGQMAALYRRSDMVLVTSDREGFGLPVVEAMACGTPVVATDLPVLREVGGPASIYRPLGDIPAWHAAILDVLRERADAPAYAARRAAAVQQAAKFRWSDMAIAMTRLYQDVGRAPSIA